MLTSILKIVKVKLNPVAAAEALATFTSICISSGDSGGVSTGIVSRFSSCWAGMLNVAGSSN